MAPVLLHRLQLATEGGLAAGMLLCPGRQLLRSKLLRLLGRALLAPACEEVGASGDAAREGGDGGRQECPQRIALRAGSKRVSMFCRKPPQLSCFQQEAHYTASWGTYRRLM